MGHLVNYTLIEPMQTHKHNAINRIRCLFLDDDDAAAACLFHANCIIQNFPLVFLHQQLETSRKIVTILLSIDRITICKTNETNSLEYCKTLMDLMRYQIILILQIDILSTQTPGSILTLRFVLIFFLVLVKRRTKETHFRYEVYLTGHCSECASDFDSF